MLLITPFLGLLGGLIMALMFGRASAKKQYETARIAFESGQSKRDPNKGFMGPQHSFWRNLLVGGLMFWAVINGVLLGVKAANGGKPIGEDLLPSLTLGSRLGEGPMKMGIYKATQPDGTVTTFVLKRGTYADMEENKPKPVDEGTWWREDGKLCLASNVNAARACFEEKALGTDGTVELSFNGVTSTMRPVAVVD